MKFIKEITKELFEKKTLAWAGVALSFVMLLGFGFNALLDNTEAQTSNARFINAYVYEESLNTDDTQSNAPYYTHGGNDNTVVIREGQDIKLKWWPQEGATTCTASGDWSGVKNHTQVTEEVAKSNTASGNYNFVISCDTAGGQLIDNIEVEVISGGTKACNPRADLEVVGDSGFSGTGIVLSSDGKRANVTVKNNSSDCTYSVGMASYKIGVPFNGNNTQEFLNSQTLFEDMFADIGPGETKIFMVHVPACMFQVDVFEGPKVSPLPPDFENLPEYNLLDWRIEQQGREACNPPPPTDPCPARADLEVIGDTGFNGTGIIISSDNKRANVSVKNNSSDCTYSVGMASYKIGVPFNGNNTSQFLNSQTLFEDSFKDIAPGQTVNFMVHVPACMFQVDVFEGPKVSPLPPDFENLPEYNLLDWKIDQNRPLCNPPTNQCPAGFDAPVITGANSINVALGGQVNYQFSVSGDGDIDTVVSNLPSWLSFNPATNRITGTANAVGTFTFTITSTGTDIPSGKTCGTTSKTVTLTVTPLQCPAGFVAPNITSAETIPNKENGDAINYLVTFSQGSASSVNVAVTGLPSWLSYNSSTRRVTGTIPANTTVNEEKFNVTVTGFSGSLACGADTIEVTITWEPGDNQCPADFDAPEITGANSISANPGDSIDYQFSVTGDGQINTNVLSLPSWLSFNPATNRITGIVPLNFTGLEDFTISSIGTDLGTGRICGETTKPVTISVTDDGQCPDNFVAPNINGDSDVTIEVGEDVDYQFSVTGDGTKTVTVSGLPDWLTFNSSARTITGTMRDETVTFTINVVARDNDGDVCGTDTLEVTLRPETDENQCPDLEPPKITSGDSFELKPGDGFNYLITFTGGGELDIDVSNLPSWLEFNENTNRVTGDMPDRNNYSFTVTLIQRDADERLCGDDEKVVKISPKPKPTGRCINCDDDDEPRVLVSSERFTPPSGEVLGIALTEIPVTGVGGTLQSIIFTIGLLIISAGLAYLIMSPKMRQKFFAIFSSRSSYMESSPVTAAEYYDSRYGGDDEFGGGYASATYSPTHPNSLGFGGAVALDTERAQKVEDRFRELTGRKNISRQEEDPFSDRIAQEIGALARRESKREVSESKALGVDEIDTGLLASKIEETAREYKVLISDDGVKTLIRSSNANESNALSILAELIKVSEEWYAREDGWLLLNQKRIKEVLFATYVMMAPSFLSWIARGDEDRMFGFIKMLHTQGHSAKEFIKNVVYELDALYRYRTEGHDSEVSNETIKLAGRWNLSTIEKMIESFIGAIDGSYSNDFTPIKLALLRAVSIAKEENRE